ncbi:MAG: TRAP transporter substrate-binding protein [Dorea sp.]|jgi:tripartite ATP-independent transporter DctP family solute receptor|nr:TRAP transporter substrate-binding protein [Dorea sp.]
MKKRLAVITALLLTAGMALSGCKGQTASTEGNTAAKNEGSESDSGKSGDAMVLRLGHVVADGNSLDKGLDKFAELVNEKSDGALVIEVYPNSELGDNTAMAEQLQMGTLDLMAPSTAALSGFTSAMSVFDVPYLFKNEAAAEEVLDGEIGQDVADALEGSGFHVLSYMTQGWRNLTCKKEVTAPADMKGIKIRTMDSQYHMQHFNAFGASATPMAMSEVYTALQQGTIDAQENPYTNIVNSRFYEVQDYVVETQHIYDADPLMVSAITWEKLTDDQKSVLEEAAAEATVWEREEVLKDVEKDKQTIIDSGTKIIELTDDQRADFREAAQEVYDSFESAQSGNADLIEQIEAVNDKK